MPKIFMRMSHFIRVSILFAAVLSGLLSVQSCTKINGESKMSSCEVSFETIVTRGPALTDESMQSFKVIAFLDDEDSTPFMNHQDVTLSDGVYKYSPIKYWPNDGTVSFFAYSASTDYGTMSAPVFEKDGSNFKATFEYELPETDGVADAASQPDLVFAQKSRCSREDGTVSFAFSHALTAIQFKVAAVPDGTKLQSIEFVDVCSKANCTVQGTPADNLTYVWTPTSTGSFVQTYSDLLLHAGDMISDISDDATFFMIPQTFYTDTDLTKRLRFTFNVDEEVIQREIYLKDLHAKWLPGEIHTYTISLD